MVTAQDVALMMSQFKMARLMQDPGHEDSISDMLGYAETYALMHEAQKKAVENPARPSTITYTT
jgi:hypothetical protein